MNTAQVTLLSFLCAVVSPGCALLRTPGRAVTLEKAVEESVVALKSAEEKARTHGHSWGLLPAEVTLIYNISNEQSKGGNLQLQAPIKSVSLGGSVSASETTTRGNQIIMKFTRHGR